MKKQLVTLLGLAIVFVFAAAFKSNKQEDPEKTAKIKIVTMVDGEKTVIDTTFTKDGDLDLQEFLGKVNVNLDLDITEEDGEMFVKVVTDGEGENEFIYTIDDLDLTLFDLDKADSLVKKIMVHTKVNVDDEMNGKSIMISSSKSNGGITIGDKDIHIISQDDDDDHFKVIKKKNSKLIDLNDDDVISVKKKDMGDGKEKIEIIRKKK